MIEKKDDPVQLPSFGEITLEEAKNWTKNWRDTELYCKAGKIKAWTVNVCELMDLLGISKDLQPLLRFEKLRFYIALEGDTLETKNVKLIFLGLVENPLVKDEFLDDTKQIFDLTSPCPSICDPGSPLYGIGKCEEEK